MIMPIPPIKPNPKSIPILIEVGKKVWGWIKDKFSKTSEEIGQEKPLTKESTIEDISKISEIFNNFKSSVEDEVKPLVIKIKNEIEDYAEELCFIVEQQNETIVRSNINLAIFRRQINKLKKNIDGKMENEISRVISLDNSECKTIVRMLPGEKKEEALKNLLSKAVNNGIEIINEKVSDTIAEINEDFEILIKQAIEKKENETNSQLMLLNDAKLMSDNQMEMKEILTSHANLTINICEIVVTNISEVN